MNKRGEVPWGRLGAVPKSHISKHVLGSKISSCGFTKSHLIHFLDRPIRLTNYEFRFIDWDEKLLRRKRCSGLSVNRLHLHKFHGEANDPRKAMGTVPS